MSILYCSLLHNKEKTKFAESTVGKNFKMQIKNLLPEIYKNSINDRIEFDDYYLTYTRSKEIIFLCISPKRVGEERARIFIETLINKLFNLDYRKNPVYASIKDCLEKHKNVYELLIYEDELQLIIDEEIKNFNTGIEDNYLKIKNIQNDLNVIKKDLNNAIIKASKNVENLDELLLTTTRIEGLGNEFKNRGKELTTREGCGREWVISISVFVSLLLIYLLIAYLRCNSYYDAFCEE